MTTLLHVIDLGEGGVREKTRMCPVPVLRHSTDLQDYGKIRNCMIAGLGTNILTQYLATQRLIFTGQIEVRVSRLLIGLLYVVKINDRAKSNILSHIGNVNSLQVSLDISAADCAGGEFKDEFHSQKKNSAALI